MPFTYFCNNQATISHVQNFKVILLQATELQQNVISSEFELQ